MKRFLVLFIIIVSIFLTACANQEVISEETLLTADAIAEVSEDGFQEVALTYGKVGPSYNYIFSPGKVEAGVPVRITADVTKLKGCYRYLQIPEYKISKYLTADDNIVTFTPTEPGDILFTCSMGMGTAILTVVNQ